MPLSDDKILRLARANLARLAADVRDPGMKLQFAAIDSALHELTLRADTVTERDYYRRGHLLAQEGLGLAKDAAITAAVATLVVEIPANTGSDLYQRELAALTSCLRQIVHALRAAKDAVVTNYLERVIAREFELMQRRGGRLAAIDTASTAVGITQAGLEPYLRQRFPQRKDLHVNNFEILAGGYSKRTIFFSIEDANGRRNGTDRVDVV